MAYTKTTWVNRLGTNLNKFTKTSETATSVILTNSPDTITQAGTEFTISRMNNIENGIDDLYNNSITIGGTKTFSNTIIGSVTGNAGTVTNGVYTTGNQSIAGVKTFTNTTDSTTSSTGAVVITGGLGVDKTIVAGGLTSKDNDFTIGFTNTGSQNNVFRMFNGISSTGGNYIFLYDKGGSAFQHRINSSDANTTFCEQGGNFGICNSSPSEKLDVSGNIKASGKIYEDGALTRTAVTFYNPGGFYHVLEKGINYLEWVGSAFVDIEIYNGSSWVVIATLTNVMQFHTIISDGVNYRLYCTTTGVQCYVIR